MKYYLSLTAIIILMSIYIAAIILASMLHSLALIVVSVVVAGIGIGFSAFILWKPFDFTLIGVVIGEVITETAASVLIGLALYLTGHWRELWWMIFIPWYAEALPGIPMAIGQLWKYCSELNHNKKLEKERERLKRGETKESR